MATQTMTMTMTEALQSEPSSSRTPQMPERPTESFELSLKSPTKSIKELSRRVAAASKRRTSSDNGDDSDDVRADIPQPATAHSPPQKWNAPRCNVGRL